MNSLYYPEWFNEEFGDRAEKVALEMLNNVTFAAMKIAWYYDQGYTQWATELLAWYRDEQIRRAA